MIETSTTEAIFTQSFTRWQQQTAQKLFNVIPTTHPFTTSSDNIADETTRETDHINQNPVYLLTRLADACMYAM